MIKVIDFIKGNEVQGSIIQLDEKSFRAVTGTQSKSYKTERGARKFMEKMGYIEVADVKTNTVGDVVEVVELVAEEVAPEVVEETVEASAERVELVADRVGFTVERAEEIVAPLIGVYNIDAVIEFANGKHKRLNIRAIKNYSIICDREYKLDCVKRIILNPNTEDLKRLEPKVKEQFNPFAVPKKDITGYEPCPNCGGSGVVTWAMHHDGGICYRCKGTGKGRKKVNRS